MSTGGNGSAWAVVGGVIAVGLCAGLATAGALVSAVEMPEFDLSKPEQREQVRSNTRAEPSGPAVIADPAASPPGMDLDPMRAPDARLSDLEAAFGQGRLEEAERSETELNVMCLQGKPWACGLPAHLGAVDRGLLESSCADQDAMACVVLGWHLTQRGADLAPVPGRADLQWLGVGRDLEDSPRDILGADAFDAGCRLGEARACGELGRVYGWGVGRAYDPEEAERLFSVACAAGEVRSCTWLGDALEARGEIEAAKERYAAVCEAGLGEGCRARAAYEDDEGPLLERGCTELRDGRACIWQAENLGNSADAAGVERLVAYCENPRLGLAYACDVAAGFYLNPGNPVEVDEARAVSLNRAGCDGGDAGACAHLGYRYQDGRGVQEDVKEAAKMLELACDQNHGEGCRELAELHFGADEATPSPLRAPQALSAMERSCELDDGEGCNRLGVILSSGADGVSKDSERVEDLYRKACGLNFAWGCYNEAWWADAGDKGEAPWAAKKLKLSCEMDLAKGCFAYAERLQDGRGVGYDPTAAKEYKAQACTLGFEEACGA